MDKFIVTQKMRKSKAYISINVYTETKALLDKLKDETGIPISRLVSEMVLFCQQRLEVKLEEPEDAQNKSRKK